MFDLVNAENLRKVVRNPNKLVGYIEFQLSSKLYYRNFEILDVSTSKLQHYEEAINRISEAFKEISGYAREDTYSPGVISKEDAESLKGLLEHKNPDVVVETGVCNGMSTLAMLEILGLHDARLYSIDLAETPESDEEKFWEGKGGSVIPSEKRPGWIIPDELRDNWDLILGNSMYELPRLLEELERIDVFVHDSEHSYEMMMFEFCIAWKHLKQGEYLICDDHNWNNAFHDFAREKNLTKYRIGNLGLLQK